METRSMAEAMQRNVEPEGSTGRALWAAQRLAIGINADWMAVWVEELAAVAATCAAVAPCRLAARAAAAIAG
jgi:hypothetical protein